MSDAQVIARAHRAASEYAELADVFEAVRGAIVVEITSTPISQPDKVLKLHMALSNLEALRKGFRLVIDSGLVADHAARSALAESGLTRP